MAASLAILVMLFVALGTGEAANAADVEPVGTATGLRIDCDAMDPDVTSSSNSSVSRDTCSVVVDTMSGVITGAVTTEWRWNRTAASIQYSYSADIDSSLQPYVNVWDNYDTSTIGYLAAPTHSLLIYDRLARSQRHYALIGLKNNPKQQTVAAANAMPQSGDPAAAWTQSLPYMVAVLTAAGAVGAVMVARRQRV